MAKKIKKHTKESEDASGLNGVMTEELMRRIQLYKDFGSIRKLIFTIDDGGERELHYNKVNGHIFTLEERRALLPLDKTFDFKDRRHRLIIRHFIEEMPYGLERVKYMLVTRKRQKFIGESPLTDVALKSMAPEEQYNKVRKLILAFVKSEKVKMN